MTFTGFAKRRNRIQSSPPQTREQRQIQAGTDQFLSDFDQRQKAEKASATQALDTLRAKFQADQDMRQSLYELQSEQAKFRREQERDIYKNEIAKLDAASAEKNELFESISSISKTANDYLLKQAEDRKENEIKFGQGSSLRFGLTPNEVADLAELDRGLDQYRLSEIPIIQKLRDMGATETELEQLIGLSGWAKEGAVRTAVQNAGADYAGYLMENSERKVLINGKEVSLAEAERDQSLEMQAAVLASLRGEFFNEYLPNVKPEYIANYSKQFFSIADAQRQNALGQKIEETAAKSNAMNERRAFLASAIDKAATQDPFDIATSLQSELERVGAFRNNATLERYLGYIAESTENKALGIETVQKFLKLNGFDQTYSELVDPVRLALNFRYDELRTANQDNKVREQRVYEDIVSEAEDMFYEMRKSKQGITEEFVFAVDERLNALGVSTKLRVQARARLDQYLQYSTQYHNDEKFRKNNAAFMAGLPSSINITDLIRANLSPEFLQQLIPMVEDVQYPSLPKGLDTRKRREIKNRLAELVFEGRQKPGEISSTLEPATDYVLSLWTQTYASEFRKDGDAANAVRVADNKVDDLILRSDEKNSELYRGLTSPGPNGTLVKDREFTKFQSGNRPTPVLSPDRADLTNKVTRDPDVINTQQLIPVDALKDYAFRLQTNPRAVPPVQLTTIYKASGIDPGKILIAQLAIARQADPSIPEVPREALEKPRQNIEAATGITLDQFTQRLISVPNDAELTLDRRNLYRGNQAVFSNEDAKRYPQRSAISYFKGLGFSDDEIVTWLAIMYGESGTSGFDTAKRENSEERSYGRFQINTLVHTEFLSNLGLKPQDMFDPRSNMKAAVMLHRRRIEAGQDGFLDWGAYTNQSYLDHIDKARQDLADYNSAPVGFQNRDNYRDDISDEDAQRLGVIGYSATAAPQLVYKVDRIGPASTGFHLDTKRVDRKFFNITDLDNYIEVELNGKRVPLSKTTQTSGFYETRGGGRLHAGYDHGLPQNTEIYAKNGAVVTYAGDSGDGNGDVVVIDIPGFGEIQFLHGHMIK